ncbi:MAG TPA: acetate/propionate family kinase [Actinomycetota bacterium]
MSDPDRLLVVNAGSSSLKLRVLDPDDAVVASEDLPAPRGRSDLAALRSAIESFGSIDAVGHRIVHGGSRFVGPVIVDDGVRAQLEALTDLAPLHQPKSLAALDAVGAILPGVPAVACFDTAFHATMRPAASTYALPREWRTRWDLRRFGFHGLSHAYAARRTAEMLGRGPMGLRIVSCHLGAGASLAAIVDGRSVDTTMGFTPLEGLVMATRSGTVDPGLVLWLEEHVGMPSAELGATLEHRSGLLGLAGTADMRTVLQAEAAGDPAAQLAMDVYLHRLRAGIASMAAAIGGLDVLVFTGGVGQNAAGVRERAAAGLAFLGIALDLASNATMRGDGQVGAEDAAVRTLVIEAREDLEIAREARQVLKARVVQTAERRRTEDRARAPHPPPPRGA